MILSERRRRRIHSQTDAEILDVDAIRLRFGIDGISAFSFGYYRLYRVLAGRGLRRRLFIRNRALLEHVLHHRGFSVFYGTEIWTLGQSLQFVVQLLRHRSGMSAVFDAAHYVT